MKIESEKTNESVDTSNNKEPNTPKAPKEPKQYSKWVYVILGLLVVVGIGYTYMTSNKSDKPVTNTSTVESTKKSEDKTTKSTESTTKDSTTVSSTKESEPEVASTVDAKPIITDFFKAYQEYSSKDKDTGARANEMVKYATKEVVNQLLPGALEGTSQQQSMIAVYKFTEPVDIQPVVGEVNKYTAVLNYTVTVMGNESTHVDSYIVGMDNDKINSLVQKSYVTK